MKSSGVFFIVFILIIFFISGCAKKIQTNNMEKMADENQTSNDDLEFKKMCQDAGYEWMLMKPTKDGKIIQNAQTCMGCMIEGIEHVCDKEKFMEYLPKR